MRFTISKKSLLEAVKGLSKVISGNMAAVEFKADAKGACIAGGDLEEYLTFTPENAVGEGSFILKLNELKQYLKKWSSSGTITFSKSNGEVQGAFHTKEGTFEHSFVPAMKEHYPVKPKVSGKTGDGSMHLFPLIKQAFTSASTDVKRNVLNGVLLEPNAIVATNGTELVKFTCESGVSSNHILPRTKILGTGFLEGGNVEVISKQSHCQFTTGPWEYIVKNVQGTYPKYHSVIPKFNKQSIKLDSDGIPELIAGLASLAPTSEKDIVHTLVDKSGIRVLPENLASPLASCPGEYNGTKAIAISFVRPQLIKALELGFNKLSFNELAQVTANGGRIGDLMIIMPMLNAPSTQTVQKAVKREETKREAAGKAGSENQETQPTNPKTEENMRKPEDTPKTETSVPAESKENNGFKIVGNELVDPFEDILQEIANVRNKSREVFDLAAVVSRKVKDVQRSHKQRDKDFKSARDLLDKLKKVSGF